MSQPARRLMNRSPPTTMTTTAATTTTRARFPSGDPAASSRRRQLREKLIAGLITAVGFTGLIALLLIMVFIAKEAIPLFTTSEGREEAGWAKLFLPQVTRAGRAATFMW